jgi:hypothetical protein
MLPPIQYHTFETRLVYTPDGFIFLRLSKHPDGTLFFISHHSISCRIDKPEDLDKFIEELRQAASLPILQLTDIV